MKNFKKLVFLVAQKPRLLQQPPATEVETDDMFVNILEEQLELVV
jgi:hypothetical protein